MSNGRLLIAGGTGFIGTAITEAALHAGHEVVLLSRGNRTLPGTVQIRADRDDEEQLRRALKGFRADVVLDLSAYTTNHARGLLSALGTRVSRALVLSSAAVYAGGVEGLPDEQAPVGGAPVWGQYGVDKFQAEEVYRAHPFEQCTIVRPPYVFGQDNSSDRETWFWARHLAGRMVPIPGDGKTSCHFVHREDLASAVMLLLQAEQSGVTVYNVADPRPVSFEELSRMLAHIASVDGRHVRVPAGLLGLPVRAWFPFRDYPCVLDTHKLTALGWTPARSLEARFAETFAYYGKSRLERLLVPNAQEDAILSAVCRLQYP